MLARASRCSVGCRVEKRTTYDWRSGSVDRFSGFFLDLGRLGAGTGSKSGFPFDPGRGCGFSSLGVTGLGGEWDQNWARSLNVWVRDASSEGFPG